MTHSYQAIEELKKASIVIRKKYKKTPLPNNLRLSNTSLLGLSTIDTFLNRIDNNETDFLSTDDVKDILEVAEFYSKGRTIDLKKVVDEMINGRDYVYLDY